MRKLVFMLLALGLAGGAIQSLGEATSTFRGDFVTVAARGRLEGPGSDRTGNPLVAMELEALVHPDLGQP